MGVFIHTQQNQMSAMRKKLEMSEQEDENQRESDFEILQKRF